MPRIEVPVLVVGGGPVGVTASLLLAHQGIESLVVERREGPHRAPQAHVVNPRTLEIFRGAGIDVEALRALATPRADGSQVVWMTDLTGEELGRLPYERQGDECLTDTPTPLLNLSQHLLEPVLLDRLRATRGAGIHHGHQWRALEQDDRGVTSEIEDLARGERYEVRSDFVLAADGAGSRIRKALGIEMVGPDQLQSLIMIHFEARLRDLVKDRPAILYWLVDPECSGVLVAHAIDGSWVFMHPYDPEAESVESYTQDRCAGIVRRAIGRDDVPFTIRDISPWTMTAQVAESYGTGRVFLVGDSAHRFPPSGGLGMNTGIQDIHNLVWKIREVRTGRAGAALLDTYERERRPVAQINTDQSLLNAMKLFELFEALGIGMDLSADRSASRARMLETLADPAGRKRVALAIEAQRDHFDMFGLQLGYSYEEGAIIADGTVKPAVENFVRDYAPTTRPGSHVPHAWVGRGGDRLSILDLLPYDRFTLITGPDGGAWAAAVSTLDDPLVRCLVAGSDFVDLEGRWAELSGIGRDGAILVRPDLHVAWRSPAAVPDPAKAIAAALATVLARG